MPQTISNQTLIDLKSHKLQRVTITCDLVYDSTPLIITEKDIVQNTFEYDKNSTTSSTSLQIGCVETSELKFTLSNYNHKFDGVRFEGADIYVVIHIGDTDIPIGRFIIDNQPRALSTIEITALDYITKFDKFYKKIGSGKTTLFNLLTNACEYCGVSLYETSITNGDVEITIPEEDGQLTWHEVICLIAEVSGNIGYYSFDDKFHLNWYGYSYPLQQTVASINSNGELIFDWYGTDGELTSNIINNDLQFTTTDELESFITDFDIDSSGDLNINVKGSKSKTININSDDRFSNTENESDITITSISYKINNTTYFFPDTEESKYYSITIPDNLLIDSDNFETIFLELQSKIVGFSYRPYSFVIHGYPHIYPLDRVNITSPTGENYISYIMKYSFKLNGNSTISAQGVSTVQNGFASVAPFSQREQQIIKTLSYSYTDKVNSNLQTATIALNKLINGCNSWYKTELSESGKITTYIHDGITLEVSKNIYKQTPLGFAFTNTGDTNPYPNVVWQYGMTSEGDVISKIVNTVGLNANWIRAGSIDASVINVENINADNINSGSIDASVINVENINGNNIVSGSIDSTKINVTALSALSANIGEGTAGLLKSPDNKMLVDLNNKKIEMIGSESSVEISIANPLSVKNSSGVKLAGIGKINNIVALISSILTDAENSWAYLKMGSIEPPVGDDLPGFVVWGNKDGTGFHPVIKIGGWVSDALTSGQSVLQTGEGTTFLFGNGSHSLINSSGVTIANSSLSDKGIVNVSSSGWTHVTFSKTFSSAPTVITTINTTSSINNSPRVANTTTTGFDIIFGGSGISNVPVNWLAIL